VPCAKAFAVKDSPKLAAKAKAIVAERMRFIEIPPTVEKELTIVIHAFKKVYSHM